MQTFRKELEELINKHSLESGSNTPDFILADFLIGCLHIFDRAIEKRNQWYGMRRITEQQLMIDWDASKNTTTS